MEFISFGWLGDDTGLHVVKRWPGLQFQYGKKVYCMHVCLTISITSFGMPFVSIYRIGKENLVIFYCFNLNNHFLNTLGFIEMELSLAYFCLQNTALERILLTLMNDLTIASRFALVSVIQKIDFSSLGFVWVYILLTAIQVLLT